MFTIYGASVMGNPGNCSYPHKHEVVDVESLKAAIRHDYVCAEYRNNYRSGDNFIGSNCLPVDCDNDHSENPDKWVTPEDVKKVFPGVTFAVHYSRSNGKVKNDRKARPKFHVLFPIDTITDAEAYADTKKFVNAIFPYCDAKALDAARFFFGTAEADVEIFQGEMNLTEYLEERMLDEAVFGGDSEDVDWLDNDDIIPEGSRNATMSRFAGVIIKKYGDTDKAYELFLEQADKCDPPLEDDELKSIYRSAQGFYRRKVQADPNYVDPEVYNDDNCYKPEDFSDAGQADVLAKYFGDVLRYSPATDFIRYNGKYWRESKVDAVAVSLELTDRQLKEARRDMQTARQKMLDCGAMELFIANSKNKAESLMNEAQKEVYEDYKAAGAYLHFVDKRRSAKALKDTLSVAQTKVELDPQVLNENGFLLGTPDATYDLHKGAKGVRAHSPEDYITKLTSVSPGDMGAELWQNFLNTTFQKDQELIDYVQMVCGLAAIGKVYVEALIIAYGDGRNGKSTFWNTVARVLGDYSGKIPAEMLTTGFKGNTGSAKAHLQGKRLIIASELPEGTRLSESVVKQLCSTDEVHAEKKYKEPYEYRPTHTLVLYTNNLPRVGASDDGIWRRLIVVPFGAKIEGDSDIKNYGDYLYVNAGPAVMSWVIEGSRKVIEAEYHIKTPDCVLKAIEEYRQENDWLTHFIDDMCEIDKSFSEKSGELYTRYRSYSTLTGEHTRSTQDFYRAISVRGFDRRKTNAGIRVYGIRLKEDITLFD